ncbi:MAG: GYF domain-containing protein [Sandaracinaceae bacterium]
MKFLCPNCKAKYQISDEKIAGRTLKMDCRRCGHPIMIRGERRASLIPGTRRPSRPRRRTGSHVGPAPTGRQRSVLGADLRRSSPGSLPPEAPSATDQWHVAINDVPVGPMRREEVERKVASGAVTAASLVWREGFDDWRPLGEVAELAPLLRRQRPPPPARIPSGARPPRPPTGRPSRPSRAPSRESVRPGAPRGNVVPIGTRLSAAAPVIEDDDLLQEEAPAARERRTHPEEREAQPPGAPIVGEAFDPFPGGATAEPPAAAPLAPTDAEAPERPSELSAAIPVEEDYRRDRGLPVGAWIAISGSAAFGVALAVMVAYRFLFGPPMPAEPVAVAPDTPTDPAMEAARRGELLELPGEQSPEADGTSDGQPAAEPGAEEPPPSRRDDEEHHTARQNDDDDDDTGSSSRPAKALDPERAAALARLQEGGSSAPISAPTRDLLADEGGGSRVGLNGDQIRRVVDREREALQRCYETAVRGAGDAPTVRMDVRITIGSSGAVTRATARGRSIGNLDSCVERSVMRWRFPRSGRPTETEFPLVFAGRN